ncbi:MAG: helix-turn-helix domain-containing protein [Balneola sp.]
MRQLAAIMFTDIVGYSALMQKDEAAAVNIRTRHRQVFQEQHQARNGTIVQYFGDGTLSFFNSAVDAVLCAVELQKGFNSGDIQVPVRIGIHLGDIFYDGTEVFGDGVNVASRIEGVSEAGAILVSESVNRELKNQAELSTVSIGNFQFKNISAPMEVFAVSGRGLKVPESDKLPQKDFDEKSVAVLPFENLSPSSENEYLCDGITEEVINALTKIQELKVTSRTSSFHFKGKKLSLKEIGEQLTVSTIVTGSIRLAGNQMRISAQLIDVTEDYSFWSESFDRSLENIFAIQDEVSLIIAERLREHLGDLHIDQQLVEPPQVSVDGYTAYLKSRYHILKMNQRDIETGMNILKEVLEQSPDYVYAWLGMHMGYALLGTLGIMKAEEAFAKGHVYLSKAIELSPDLPECQLQMAWMSFLQDWDLEATYKHLQKVHDGRPMVDYYQTMTSVIITEKKFEAAKHYIDTALKLDPFSDITHHLKGFACYVQEDFEQAINQYQKSIELKPGAEVSYMELGQSLILLGRAEDALDHFQKIPEGSDLLIKTGGITLAKAALGIEEEVILGISKLEESLQSEQMERALNFLILIETTLGNYEQALDYIEQGISYRLPMLLYLKIDPMLKPLVELTRFKELMNPLPESALDISVQESKYKKSLISDEDLVQYRKELSVLMRDEQPFLDPFLTLKDLAENLGIPANHLSQLLNDGFDQNFAEFVNSYRLDYFKKEIRKPEKQNFTLLALAFESGFNSKTVFNSFFKKATGTTPSKYLKSVLKQ